MCPLLLNAGYSEAAVVFCCPLFFGECSALKLTVARTEPCARLCSRPPRVGAAHHPRLVASQRRPHRGLPGNIHVGAQGAAPTSLAACSPLPRRCSARSPRYCCFGRARSRRLCWRTSFATGKSSPSFLGCWDTVQACACCWQAALLRLSLHCGTSLLRRTRARFSPSGDVRRAHCSYQTSTTSPRSYRASAAELFRCAVARGPEPPRTPRLSPAAVSTAARARQHTPSPAVPGALVGVWGPLTALRCKAARDWRQRHNAHIRRRKPVSLAPAAHAPVIHTPVVDSAVVNEPPRQTHNAKRGTCDHDKCLRAELESAHTVRVCGQLLHARKATL